MTATLIKGTDIREQILEEITAEVAQIKEKHGVVPGLVTILVGENPVEVSTQGLPDKGVYSEDNVVMNFRFSDGSLGVVSYLANGDKSYPKEYLEVFSGGRIGILHDWRKLELVHNGRRKVKRHFLRQDKGHQQAWMAFIEALQGDKTPPIPYQQLIGVTRASFAAVEALHSGLKIAIS